MVAEKIKKEKMPLFYSKLDEFISLPPNYTGFGLAWIEAMACGVKKIVGNNNGIGSELPITKVDNYSGISEALEKAESKDYRTWLIKNKIFDTNENAKKIESVLKGGF